VWFSNEQLLFKKWLGTFLVFWKFCFKRFKIFLILVLILLALCPCWIFWLALATPHELLSKHYISTFLFIYSQHHSIMNRYSIFSEKCSVSEHEIYNSMIYTLKVYSECTNKLYTHARAYNRPILSSSVHRKEITTWVGTEET